MLLHLAVFGAATASASSEPTPLRYDLRAGDRLVYRERLERRSRGERGESAIEVQWTTRVLVLGGSRESLIVGFQRRRESAELLRAGAGLRDRTKEERPVFLEQLARRPSVAADANVFDGRGRRLGPVRVDREWPSQLLPALQEIEALPEEPVAVGSEWKASGLLGLEFRAEAWEDVGGDRCLRARGRSDDGAVTLRLWFSPTVGALARLDLDGRYSLVGQEIHEQWSFELIERHRDEALRTWLGSPDERHAALEGLLLTEALPVPFPQVEGLLLEKDAEARRRALALLWQRRRSPPPPEILTPLLADENPRIRVLAVRMLEQSKGAAARAHLEEPRPPGPLASIVAAVRRGSEWADWRCEAEPDWAARALLEQRASAQPPGVTVRGMTTDEFRGRPYVLRLPEDYRGDEPFPLLIHLAGGPGHALLGWSSAAEALLGTGYIVVAPQAAGMWWSAESERLVVALLDEVLAWLNVDPNRVFLAGFSNGGTGVFRLATLWPDRLAAAVSLEGGGMFVREGQAALPAGMGRLPMLFVHGDRDEVLGPNLSTDTVSALKRAVPEAAVELKILPGRGHDIVLGRDEGLTLAFLERHRRDPFPREVAFEINDLRAPRRYWIEVLEKGGGRARVEGRLNEDGGVELRTKNVVRLRLLLRRELVPPNTPLRVRLDGREVWSGPVPEDCSLLQRSWREARDPFRAHSAEVVLMAGR